MSRWAYPMILGATLTLATLTTMTAVSAVTVLAPGHLAGVARDTLADPVASKVVAQSLAGVLEQAGVDPTGAPEVAAAIISDPKLMTAIDKAATTGDTSALPDELAAVVAPYSGSAASDVSATIAQLLAAVQGAGITDPSQLNELDLSGIDLNGPNGPNGQASPAQAAPAVSTGGDTSTTPPATVAAPAPAPTATLASPEVAPVAAPTPALPTSWVTAHSTALIIAGGALSVLGLMASFVVGRSRRTRTLGRVGWWALTIAGLPLLGVTIAAPHLAAAIAGSTFALAASTLPRMLAPAVPMWTALTVAGAVAVSAAGVIAAISRRRQPVLAPITLPAEQDARP